MRTGTGYTCEAGRGIRGWTRARSSERRSGRRGRAGWPPKLGSREGVFLMDRSARLFSGSVSGYRPMKPISDSRTPTIHLSMGRKKKHVNPTTALVGVSSLRPTGFSNAGPIVSGLHYRPAPCSFELFSKISSHSAVFFSHNKPANSTFSHNKPAKRTGCRRFGPLKRQAVLGVSVFRTDSLAPV
jgi:hypothetical protein